MHVVVQCSGVEYTAETVEGLKYAGEGQAVTKSTFDGIYFTSLSTNIGEGPGGRNCPLIPSSFPPNPGSAGPGECITVLSLHSLVT